MSNLAQGRSLSLCYYLISTIVLKCDDLIMLIEFDTGVSIFACVYISIVSAIVSAILLALITSIYTQTNDANTLQPFSCHASRFYLTRIL